MTYFRRWPVFAIAIAITTLFGLVTLPSLATPLSTPIRGPQRYQTSSNNQADNCDRSTSQARVVQIEVKEPLVQLTMSVSGNSGQPTLRIIDDQTGRETCVTADNLSGSQVDLTAAWEGNAGQGRTYSVFVGDYKGEVHNYTLTIRQQ